MPPQERIVAAEPGRAESDEAEPDQAELGQAEVPVYTAEMFSRSVGPGARAREMVGHALPAAARALFRQVFRVVHSLIALAIRDKLETLAILLLGVGGAVYPPVWFLGAFLALISPKWDLRDKLLGLVLPAILVVFGAVMVVALGSARSTLTQYGVEGWLAAGRLSRVGAVIGAGYLLRRVYRGKRAQKPPPWSRTQGGRRSPGSRQPPR